MENPKEIEGRKKEQMYLMPPEALKKCVKVLEFGASKYGEYNWRKEPIKLSTYISAIMRHITQVNSGEMIDSESSIDHLAHIMASCALVMDANAHGSLIDDIDRSPKNNLPTLREMSSRHTSVHVFNDPLSVPFYNRVRCIHRSSKECLDHHCNGYI